MGCLTTIKNHKYQHKNPFGMSDEKELDYLEILKAIDIMPFGIGKNLLLEFLQGNSEKDAIRKHSLNKYSLFGFFGLYKRQEIDDMIENLMHNGLIDSKPLSGNRFIKVIELTDKGIREIASPSLYKKKLSRSFAVKETPITDNDREIFAMFDFFLSNFNEEQKKAIISPKSSILCIAGAGSGKTAVLTKRIEFLAAFKSIKPSSILAITFTRKARAQMISRLSKSPYCNGAVVETFNSFCEKIVKEHNDSIYKVQTRIASYSDKARIFRAALKEVGIDIGIAIDGYFSFGQKKDKTGEELAAILMNDCYSVLELYKSNAMNLSELKKIPGMDDLEKKTIEMIYKICCSIDYLMRRLGFRDYADQLNHCISFFRENPKMVPRFEYVLVDEYQDVNSSQVDLLDILKPDNLFVVGDPRQSIFGWRGSKISYILNFEEKHPDCETITLTTNYRSSSHIVELMNKSLDNMKIPELKASFEGDNKIHLLNFESEDDERNFIIAKINELSLPRNEIFVLARTNRMVKDISQSMKIHGIKHLVKTDETKTDDEASEDEVVIATIHSIKGLESSAVFVAGCSGFNFPCKASDHPIMDAIKVYDYDKEEEERRLFYVALSRAKNEIYLTYTGKSHTRFINQKMLDIIGKGARYAQTKFNTNDSKAGPNLDVFSRLKAWRKDLSENLDLPAYIIMHDKTLMDIATLSPSSLQELKEISGIGPAKLQRYGKEILDIVSGLKI